MNDSKLDQIYKLNNLYIANWAWIKTKTKHFNLYMKSNKILRSLLFTQRPPKVNDIPRVLCRRNNHYNNWNVPPRRSFLERMNSKQSFILLVSNFAKWSLPSRTGWLVSLCETPRLSFRDFCWSSSLRLWLFLEKYTNLIKEPVNQHKWL